MKENILKFIHCSDLHIDSIINIKNSNFLINDLSNTNLKVFKKIAETAVNEKVDFILISGDVFDNAYLSVKSKNEFSNILNILNENSIKVYISFSKNDNYSFWKNFIKIPPNVHIFSSEKIDKIEFLKDENKICNIYGKSECSENDILDTPINNEKQYFSIGLFHFNLEESNKKNVEIINRMKFKKIDYWALGSKHSKEILSLTPHIIYPGIIQGRNFFENNTKGFYIVEIDKNYEINLKFEKSQILNFSEIVIDTTELKSNQDLCSLINEKIDALKEKYTEHLAINILLTGKTNLYYLFEEKYINKITKEIREYHNYSDRIIIIENLTLNIKPNTDFETRKKTNDFTSRYLKEMEKILEENPVENIVKILKFEDEYFRTKKVFDSLSEEEIMELFFNSAYEGYSTLEGEKKWK